MARLKQNDNSRTGGNSSSRNADIPSSIHAAAILPLSLIDVEGVKRGRPHQVVEEKTKRHKRRRGEDEAGKKVGGKGRSDAGDKADGGGRSLHPLTNENIMAISAPDTQLEEQSLNRIYAWLSTAPTDQGDDGGASKGEGSAAGAVHDALLSQSLSSSSHTVPAVTAAVAQHSTHSGFFVHPPRAQTAAAPSNAPSRIPLQGPS